jgi:ubiquitin carboxyl-terminal hydrolase 9/24
MDTAHGGGGTDRGPGGLDDRSRARWWFISEADKEQPGTDKDIDYWQHRSSLAEEHEPNPTGWLTCTSQSEPPPCPALLAELGNA